MSSDGLDILASILNYAEAIGQFPKQIGNLMVVLLAKTDGGTRPIGLFHSIARVWAKARKALVAEWEASLPFSCLSCFSASSGRSPVDAVFRQALRAELATAGQQHYAAILWDLSKCYENVSHSLLWRTGVDFGYPLALLRMSIRSYRAPRLLSVDSLVSQPMRASRSIVAGSAFATFELKLYMLPIVKRFCDNYVNIGINIQIDDIAIDYVGDIKNQVKPILVEAALDLASDFEVLLRLPIARPKGAVVANSQALSWELQCALGPLGGPKKLAAEAVHLALASAKRACANSSSPGQLSCR